MNETFSKKNTRKRHVHRDVPSSPILDYYRGEGTDQSNRTLRDVWNFSFQKLEQVHDYIQWLFPTSQRSVFNDNAPVLTLFDKMEFSNIFVYRKHLNRSLDVMLKFYGLERHHTNGRIVVHRNPVTFRERSEVWLHPRNHNFFRLSRILRSLRELDMKENAEALYRCLMEELYPLYTREIGESVKYWKIAYRNS